MPGTGTATVSGYTGPGRTVTDKVISNIQAFFVNINKATIFFYLVNDDPTGPMREFELGTTMTFTATIANGNWTIVVDATP